MHRIIIVPETHWDRAWYSPFQEFRIRLVKLFDRLLDMLDNQPEYKVFVFDGQTIVLEDYLEVRPENEERVRRYIEEGRIEVGPWYVLCDEFLVSGEAIVRNLLIGKHIAEDFGGRRFCANLGLTRLCLCGEWATRARSWDPSLSGRGWMERVRCWPCISCRGTATRPGSAI